MIDLVKAATPTEAAQVVAERFADLIRKKPNGVIGLATGSTPIEVYKILAGMNLDWSGITTFNLDEYIGLGPEHPQSYYYFMNEHLFKHVNLKRENINFLNGMAGDIDAECQRYEKLMLEKPIDIQILGIGTNGHIAFNEPGSSFESTTRKVALTQQTIRDNSRFFQPGEFQPTTALSMGIASIMRADQIVLLATGANKSDAVKKCYYDAATPDVPASALKTHHNATIVVSGFEV